MRNSFGANTPATRGFPGQTTRPFRSGGAEWNRVNGRAVGTPIVLGDSLRGKALGPAPRFRDDSAVRVKRAEWNLVIEGAVGALIFCGCGAGTVPLITSRPKIS